MQNVSWDNDTVNPVHLFYLYVYVYSCEGFIPQELQRGIKAVWNVANLYVADNNNK